MKALSIILTCALVGAMGWLIFSSNNDARSTSAKGQLTDRGQGTTSPATDKQMAALESQLLAEQASKQAPAPVAAPTPPRVPPISVTPPPVPLGSTPAVTAALQVANALPPPQTQRQRQIMGLPALAEVKHYAKDYGFIEITAGTGRRIEIGQGFAIRRGDAIIARVKVTDVEAGSAVADVDSRSLPPGVLIEIGDEVIQDVPPES